MQFTPGDYYVGDLCYVMAHWDDFSDAVCKAFDAVDWQDAVSFTYRGFPVWDAPTAYGDGSYTDNYNRTYGVDSGSIGIVPVILCDPAKLNTLNGLGHITTFAYGVTPQWEKGVFNLNDIIIDTTGQEEEES